MRLALSPRTVVRKPVTIAGRRATLSGAVLCIPQSDSGVVVEVLPPQVVVAILEILLLESLRLVIPRVVSTVPAVARPRLLLGGLPIIAVNPRLLVLVLGVEVPGSLVLVVHPHKHLVYTSVECAAWTIIKVNNTVGDHFTSKIGVP